MKVKVEGTNGTVNVYYLANIDRIRFRNDTIQVVMLDNRVVTFKKHKSYNTSDWGVLTHQLQSEIDFTLITKHSKFEETRIVNGVTNTTIHLKG